MIIVKIIQDQFKKRVYGASKEFKVFNIESRFSLYSYSILPMRLFNFSRSFGLIFKV